MRPCVLEVESCYFKVHRYFLRRDSQVFRDLFMCPSGASEPEGRTKETAIVLPGVTKYEMSCLLKFLYHGFVYQKPSYHSLLSPTYVHR